MKTVLLLRKVKKLILDARSVEPLVATLILKLKDGGATNQDIANHLGCSVAHVSLCLHNKRAMSFEMLLPLIDFAISRGISSV